MFTLDFWFKNLFEFGWGAQCDASTMFWCYLIDYMQFVVNALHVLGWIGIVAFVLFVAYMAFAIAATRYMDELDESDLIQARLDKYVGGRI